MDLHFKYHGCNVQIRKTGQGLQALYAEDEYIFYSGKKLMKHKCFYKGVLYVYTASPKLLKKAYIPCLGDTFVFVVFDDWHFLLPYDGALYPLYCYDAEITPTLI